MRLVLICVGVACVLVLVGLPLLATWAMSRENAPPGDID